MNSPAHSLSLLVAHHILWIWAIVLFAAVAWAFFSRSLTGKKPGALTPAPQPETGSRAVPWAAADGISVLLFLGFLAAYLGLAFYREDFADYDNSIFTCFSLRGRSYAPPVWPQNGRFWPLGHGEFNALRFVTRSSFGYHAFAAAELLFLLVALFLLLKNLAPRWRFCVLGLIALMPSILIAFFGLVYPERNVAFWLALLLLSVLRYDATESSFALACALGATQFALYYKEPVFVLVLVFASVRLLLGYRAQGRDGGRSFWRFAAAQRLELGMIALACLFLVAFAAALLPFHSFAYATNYSRGSEPIPLRYLSGDPLLLAFAVALVFRVWSVFRDGEPLDPVWDALALAALFYGLAYVGLRMFSGYYMAPVDLVAVMYLARRAVLGWSSWAPVRRFAFGFLVVFVLAQDLVSDAFRLVEHKDVIEAKAELAQFLKARAAASKQRTLRVFFPFANGYRIMELSAFFDYKGLPVAGAEDATAPGAEEVEVESPLAFPSGRCVDYMPIRCQHLDRPMPGDLVVVLPDDNVSSGEVATLSQHASLVFSYRPSLLARDLLPLMERFDHLSPTFQDIPPPDHWLRAEVLSSL